ncbi:hypothetical protein KSP40_PGU005189 [Platanthera guangdongensis]|uniref:Uncharacterized protein n=1 Tax=Platanthera guangdongensis TaxID=2320717 RepID=A0ABR2N224_9ASPA
MPAIEPPENGGTCRKHPSATISGVCPSCLRGRLSLLCADCAKLRPCPCDPLPPASEHQSAQSTHASSPAAAAAVSAAKVDSDVRSSSARGCKSRDGWRGRWKCLNLQFSNPCRVFRRKHPAKVS